MFGYMGKILRVNLSNGKITPEEIDTQLAQNFIGGAGFACKILYDEVPAKADPLGENNRLIFMTGPVTGTRFPTSGRYVVGAKSPLTGIGATTTSSGFWGPELKYAGFDGIVFEGKADKPVYLEIREDKAELKDASDVWGKDSDETQDILRAKMGEPRARVACIGQAGENQIPIACVMNDEGRAAGRGGIGAVMGSKNLKAIIVRGNKKIEIAAPEFFNEMAKTIATAVGADPFMIYMTKWGTANNMDSMPHVGDVPIKNWAQADWDEGCRNLGGAKMEKTILVPHKSSCFNCPIRCARWVKVPSGKWAFEGAGPEYETLGALGSMCLNDNLEAVSYIGMRCNKYGMDTISAGATIAWAMEAYEKGAITKKDTGGIELTWGNADAIAQMVELMGQNKGFGAILAQGSRRASAKIGKGSEKYAIHVKALELPMHDPRAFHGMAVNYATGPRGACHCQGLEFIYELAFLCPEAGITHCPGRHGNKSKGLTAKVAQDLSQVVNSLAVCEFAGNGLQPSHSAMLLGICAAMPHTAQTVLQAGERIINIQRAFAVKEGISRKDDIIPQRITDGWKEGESLRNPGAGPNLEVQLEEYYQLRGWDENGIPTKERLKLLGLDKVVADLYPS